VTDDFYCDEVLSGKTEVRVVRETDNVLAYHHTRPFWPAHVVVIPKRHIASLNDIGVEDDQLVGELVRRAAALAKDRGLSAGGYRTVFNTNRDAGQTVFHVHLHLLGGRSMSWPPG